MNTTKIFTKAIFVVSILLSALLIGCNDMIEPMAQVELTVRMDDHNIPLTSSFTLYGTKQGSRATIQKELGSLNAISLLPLEPGIWDLTVEAKVEGIRKGTGSRTVSVNKGQKVSAVIELAYEYDLTFNANEGTPPSMAGKDVIYDAEYGPLATTERTGYTFLGWYTAINGGTKIEETDKFTQTTNQVLYAQWEANSYSITFDMQQGSGGSVSTTATFGAAMQSGLTVPSRTGYTFDGYYDAANGGGTQYYTATMASARAWDKTAPNTTLYAKWTADSYTITYNLNDGTNNAGNPATYTIESATIALQAPTRAGYTFGGWYATDTFSGSALTTITQGSTGSKTLYAKWTATSYTVSFDKQSGTGGSGSVSATYDAAMPTGLEAPNRTGYTFGGYYDAANGGGTQYYTATMVSARAWDKTAPSTTLYAKWTADSYTITYNLNNGTNNAGNPATYTIESSAIALLAPTRNGYTFGGWYENISLTGSPVTEIPHGSTENKTLYAKWTATIYTITYNLNNGTNNAGNHTAYTIESSAITLLAPTRNGYTFGGWYGNAALTGVQVTSIAHGSSGNSEVWAKWTATSYTITYNLNNGTNNAGNPATYTVESSTIALLAPTRTGYTFSGWYADSNFTGGAAASILQGSTENKTLYAKWTPIAYSISYVLNDGTIGEGNPNSYTIESSTIALQNPTRTGYTFGGWFETDTFSGTALATIAQGSTGNKTLYAKWTVDSYTITYNLNNGTNNAGNPATYTVESSAIALLAPTRNGYTFGGWFETDTFSDTALTTIAQGSTGNKTLYAKWASIAYSISYVLNDGTNNVGNPATYTIESSAIALQNPTRTGYTFGG
ncbi:MAG: hypothetical protein EOM48_09240, partial [Bacilli bacterium]|nr:hypothetical protein [Bacilli bacterium]